MAKVITMKTWTNAQGIRVDMVATIPASVHPNEWFMSVGLSGRIESYEVSNSMPLPLALEYSYQIQRKMGITK